MTVEVLTFGCRLNTYESEAMRDLATKAGHDGAIVVNTCAVTAEAERQARQAIRRAARDNPGARILVTGCAAQIDPAAWAALPGRDGRAIDREPFALFPRTLGAWTQQGPRQFLAPDVEQALGADDYHQVTFAASGQPLPVVRDIRDDLQQRVTELLRRILD